MSVIGHGTGASAGLISNLSELDQLQSSHLESVSRLVGLAPCIVRNSDYSLFTGDLSSTKTLYLFTDYFFPGLAFLDVIDQAYYDYINNTSFPGGLGSVNVPGIDTSIN